MTLQTSPATRAMVDLRGIVMRERHPLIFSAFNTLAEGQSMQLVNDHDPQPLRRQFEADLAGRFSWNTVEAGPEVWRIDIRRLANAPASGGCCGHCGGG